LTISYEVYYIILRQQSRDIADLAFARIKALPVNYIDSIDDELLRKAAWLKENYPISYADALAASMAIIYKSSLLTGDSGFKELGEKEAVAIQWLT